MQKTIKHTFTLTNLSEHFYEQLSGKPDNMERWHFLIAYSTQLPKCIKASIHSHNTDMRARTEFNNLFAQTYKKGGQPDYNIADRKGYKLVTFYF